MGASKVDVSKGVALLTIYDMCKALSKSMMFGEIRLERKIGGKSGIYVAPEN